MKLLESNLNSLWASLIVEELVRNGIDYFCLAPGSRCTPLTVAIASNPNTTKSLHYDERGLAFHALGYGRASRRPAVVVTTSGTAVANLMPAVIEASMEQIPLLLLTGDRPPELRDTTANQTIDQVKIFGDYVRWFVDLPCPNRWISPAFVLTTLDQAIHRCHGSMEGPVHINCMFREPLAPESQGKDFSGYLKPISSWAENKLPYTEYIAPERSIGAETLERLSNILKLTERGLVVIGGISDHKAHPALDVLIKKLNWPVCADITSGFRLGDCSGLIVFAGDILARNQAFSKTHAPEVVLHLGGRIVSKHLEAFLHKSKPSEYILISDNPKRHDPLHGVTLRIEADITSTCFALTERLDFKQAIQYLNSWQEKMHSARKVFKNFKDHESKLSEPLIANLVSQNVPPDHGLFLANSMPVRDMNSFAETSGALVPVGANRGASGIDGTIATAAGLASGLKRPVTLLIGDIAFLHDLNSLNYLSNSKYPITAIVINNNGGGIFSHLPIAGFEEFFERYFVTPHELTFEKAAGMYGLSYYHPETRQEFLSCYQKAIESRSSTIMEVTIDRKTNHALYTQLITDMHSAME